MSIGERIRSERERLEMSQPQFAKIAGTTKQTLFSWESGKTSPNAGQMASLAAAGVDITYIVTGQRSQAAPPPEPSITLNRKERAFWDMFKELDEQDQREIYQDIKEKKRIADMEKRLQEYEALNPSRKKA